MTLETVYGQKEDPLYFNLMGNYEARVSRESFVRRVVSLREIGRIYSSNRPGKKQRMKRMNGTENLKSKIHLIY